MGYAAAADMTVRALPSRKNAQEIPEFPLVAGASV
jgi:hypothetical protein